MEATKKVFRTAVSGYNKQDVNDYIAALMNDYERDKLKLTARIDELEAAVNEEEDLFSVDEPSERECELEAELEKANALIAEQGGTLEAVRGELDTLKAELCAKSSENSELKERLSLYVNSDDKLKSYERVSSQLGALMIEAASNADKIKSDAEAAARQTLADAEERERELIEKYERLAGELEANYMSACEAVDRKLGEYTEGSIKSLETALCVCANELCAQLEAQKARLRGAVDDRIEIPEELKSVVKPSTDCGQSDE